MYIVINFNIEKDKEQGNIYIQSTIKKPNNKQNIKIQIGIINPKNQMKKKMKISQNNENEGIKFDEERIIFDAGYNNKRNNKNSSPIKSNKNYHKNNYLYIPNIIEEQIIFWQIDFEWKEKNNDNNEEDINDKNYNENNIIKEE